MVLLGKSWVKFGILCFANFYLKGIWQSTVEVSISLMFFPLPKSIESYSRNPGCFCVLSLSAYCILLV